MLPDFPGLKSKIQSIINQRMRRTVYGSGVLSRIRRLQAHEGDTFSTYRLDGSVQQSGTREIGVEFSVDKNELAKLTPKELVEKVDRVALEMAEKTSKGVFEDIRKVTDETGNVVDSRGQPFSFDLLLQGLEKIEMDFDEHGQPTGLTIVMHPELGKRVPELIKQWEANPDFKKRYDELIEKKREAWSVRESRRKLVD